MASSPRPKRQVASSCFIVGTPRSAGRGVGMPKIKAVAATTTKTAVAAHHWPRRRRRRRQLGGARWSSATSADRA